MIETESPIDHRSQTSALRRTTEICATIVFIFLALALVRGLSADFDERVAHWVQSQSSDALDLVMHAITSCGNTLTIILVTALSSALLFRLTRRKRAILLIWLACGIGYGINNLAKYLFARPRPQLSTLFTDPSSYSFPSGHAMVSTVVYGCLVFMLARAYPGARWPLRVAVSIFIFLIGLSRVYLDVHWPTDVIAGFALGFLVLSALLRWYDFDLISRSRSHTSI